MNFPYMGSINPLSVVPIAKCTVAKLCCISRQNLFEQPPSSMLFMDIVARGRGGGCSQKHVYDPNMIHTLASLVKDTLKCTLP